MKMTFRWYGDSDPISLDKIRQIPNMSGVVSAIYDIPVGEAWGEERIKALVDSVHAKGLELEVIESVPVHEDIKMGCGDRDRYIANYCTTLKNLGKYGIKCVCYNFMPVFDWTRSDLNYTLPDGSTALIYDEKTVLDMNPLTGDLSLPGWDSSYTKADMQNLLKKYESVDEEKLWENMKYFLERIIPAAESSGINMAIHPDDPPWSIFGLPRIITSKESIQRFLDLVPSKNNGITLCTGSLGVSPKNDLVDMAKTFADRIHFAHIRNIKITGEKCFEEAGHLSKSGSLDMVAILKALKTSGFEGYVRPDHGRMIWGETGKPGYGLFDRALGAAYINGIWETLEKEVK